MRFTAPDEISEVFLSNGPHKVVNGVLEIPDDTPPSDVGSLSTYGFVPAPATAGGKAAKDELKDS